MPELYTLPCPNCGSYKTYYATSRWIPSGDVVELNTWICEACGLDTAPLEEWIRQ